MLRKKRSSLIRRSTATVICLGLVVTTLFTSCGKTSSVNNNSTISSDVVKLNNTSVVDNMSNISSGDGVSSNITRFKFKEMPCDTDNIGIDVIGVFPIYKDDEGYFIWSNNKRVELELTGEDFATIKDQKDNIVLRNNTGVYSLYRSNEDITKQQEEFVEFLNSSTSKEAHMIIEKSQMITVSCIQVPVLSSQHDMFELATILDALNISYEVKKDRIDVVRFDNITEKNLTVHIPLAEKGQVIQDTCSEEDGQHGTNIIVAASFIEDGKVYADRSTIYDILGINLSEDGNGYAIGTASMVAVDKISLTENAPAEAVFDIDVVDHNMDDIIHNQEFSKEELVASMDEDTKEWADKIGIVFQQENDADATAANACAALKAKYSTLDWETSDQGVRCTTYMKYRNEAFDGTYDNTSAEQLYAELTAKYGSSPDCLKNRSPEEWVVDAGKFEALAAKSGLASDTIVEYAAGADETIFNSGLTGMSFTSYRDVVG